MVSISEEINRLRGIRKISQREMADKIGMSFTGLQGALKNNSFKVDVLEKIAHALGVDITHFFKQNDGNKHENFFLKGNQNTVANHGAVDNPPVSFETQNENLKKEIELLKNENQLLKERIKDKEEFIEFLKNK